MYRHDETHLLTRTMVISPASVNDDTREVEVVAATGAGVRRYDWERGVFFLEQLEISPEAVDMTRIQNGVCPALYNHNRYDGHLGAVTNARVEAKALIATLRLGVDVSEFIDQAWKLISQGLLRGVSVGYRVMEYRRIAAKNEQSLDIYIATKWEILEISFVTIPADSAAFSRSE